MMKNRYPTLDIDDLLDELHGAHIRAAANVPNSGILGSDVLKNGILHGH